MKRADPGTVGIIALSALVLIESVQLVIVLGLITYFLPFKLDAFNAQLLPAYKSSLKPNYQSFIYHIFILTCLFTQALGIYVLRNKLMNREFQQHLKDLLWVDAIWIFIQCFAAFKISIYHGPEWAWALFYVSLSASILSRIFWAEIRHVWGSLSEYVLRGEALVSVRNTFAVDQFVWTPLLIIVGSIQVIIVLYFIFTQARIGSALTLGGFFVLSVGLFSFLVRIKSSQVLRSKAFIAAETLLTFFLLSALYKMTIYDYRSQLATHAFYILLVLAVLNKFCWSHIWSGLRAMWTLTGKVSSLPALKILGEFLFIFLIILMIYIPDIQAVLAKMFMGDNFFHTDSFIMAPAWAWVSGCILDVDVISRYGIGIPIVISSLTKCLGGFSYANVFLVVMWICIIYYLLCYLFLRLWLNSFILSAAAILVGIKTQMFYSLSYPQPFTYTSATPVRFMLDIVFMLCIWGHLRSPRMAYMLLAALCAGTSFFFVPETGLYLASALAAYLMLGLMVPNLRRQMYGSVINWIKTAFCALAMPLSAVILMWCALGNHLWTKEFWDNFTEFSKFFTSGVCAGPFDGGLQYGQFWDLLVGMAFPLVYMLTILIIGSLCVLGKISERHVMAVVLSFYGLATHHYYVVMATTNNYYPRGLPFVFIIFYWAGFFLKGLNQDMQRKLGAVLLAFCVYALWTNHHFLSYPNVFNLSRNPMVDPLVAERMVDRSLYFNHKVRGIPEDIKMPLNSLGEKNEDLKYENDFASDEKLKAYYKEQSDFYVDARLIQSLVPKDQPVALLSSWETDILMQANRRPFFYYFRLFLPRPMQMRSLESLDILTTGEINKLIGQMQTTRPDYVFMERLFLQPLTSVQRAAGDIALVALLDYVRAHYEPYSYGKYLVAMKRVQ